MHSHAKHEKEKKCGEKVMRESVIVLFRAFIFLAPKTPAPFVLYTHEKDSIVV